MYRPDITSAGNNSCAGITTVPDGAHEMTLRFTDGSTRTVYFDHDERAIFHTAVAHSGAVPADVIAVIVNDIRIVGGHRAYA